MNENRDKQKRVIMITGDEKKLYERAIFIMKRDACDKGMPKDAVLEAESIVERYLSSVADYGDCAWASPCAVLPFSGSLSPKKDKNKTKKSGKRFDVLLNFLMLVCCVVFAILLAYNVCR